MKGRKAELKEEGQKRWGGGVKAGEGGFLLSTMH